MSAVAVLFARADSVYKTIPGCDVYDMDRDARTYDGPWPVVAHPPCRAWGNFAMFAKPRPDERNLARLAVALVREFGGVLEHPYGSKLWKAQMLPNQGERDQFGGFTLVIDQHWWGHRAQKRTKLYIVGVEPSDVPDLPMKLGRAEFVIGDVGRASKGDDRPEISKAEREHTPPELAMWLLELARRCKTHMAPAMLSRILEGETKTDIADCLGEPCEFCGHKFRSLLLGRYGCPNCNGEGFEVAA